jgi:hypothetical protein
VLVPPREGLPLGLRLFSLYAPLERDPTLEAFSHEVAAWVATLDLQVPTLILGDFNGSVDPERDFSVGARRPVSPLLSRLLGPGGPFLDLQLVVSPELRQYTFRSSRSSGPAALSRCDLLLANRAALPLVARVWVESGVADGGHSPVLASLRCAPWPIAWCRPRPRLPALLQASRLDLAASPEWTDLVKDWKATPAYRGLLAHPPEDSPQRLSSALGAALDSLVSLAGGWTVRSAPPRPAYASTPVLKLRAGLTSLARCDALLRRDTGVGPFSTPLLRLLDTLRRQGFAPLAASRSSLQLWVAASLTAHHRLLADAIAHDRAVRIRRWQDALPALWETRPGVIFRWLRGETPVWGSVPIVGPSGLQCATAPEVDAEVRGFWVSQVWGQHASDSPSDCWAAVTASPFFPFFPPRASWPSEPWTLDRVSLVLRRLRAGSAPGPRGLPISLWQALPSEVVARLADLLTMIEATGVWPRELLQGYVALIPKASGGSRPQDQRPIAVLDVLYRLWAKGVTLSWAPVLHGAYLGASVLGFRSQAGTCHVAQLLSDLIGLQQRRKRPLWLVTFDLEKCFAALPWWAVFGAMDQAGVPAPIVRCFRTFYAGLRQRFRLGQVDGEEWQARNGLAQGCPASPDLLNLLMEPFHRWAAGQGFGVPVQGGARVASTSYADDLGLAADEWPHLVALVQGYLDWCSLLHLKVHLAKTQIWSLGHPGGTTFTLPLRDGPLTLISRSTFRMVGVELGACDAAASRAQLAPRLPKALLAGKRLSRLPLPSGVLAHLWRAVILPQALYGCEVRSLPAQSLQGL